MTGTKDRRKTRKLCVTERPIIVIMVRKNISEKGESDMGLFSGQFSSVVEWEEYRDDIIFWKFANKEIKKGSRLIIRQGQDAVFMYNGVVEGIFKDEGNYDIESDIIPFLSTLAGFKFGFNSGLRAEVLFVNTKEFNLKWGTKNAINLPAPNLPGGMPVRAFGNFQFKAEDYMKLIENVAGVKQQFTVDEVRDRVIGRLDQLLMKWIAKEGKDMFNLQANAYDISKGICQDLNEDLMEIGIGVTGFAIQSVTYPEEIQKMVQKVAAQSMIGNQMGVYQNVAMTDAMAQGKSGSGIAQDMVGMQMGMMMGQQMMNNMNQMNQAGGMGQMNGMNQANPANQAQGACGFCPNCGSPAAAGANFCTKCGQKLN